MTPYALGIVSAMMVATSQLLLKLGANHYGGSSMVRQYLNGFVLTGYFLFFLVTVVNVYVFSIVPLKMANIYVALAYVGVIVLSKIYLGESIRFIQYIGLVFIIFGTALFVL